MTTETNIEQIINNLNVRIKTYSNFLLDADKYEDRVFYLTLCNKESLIELTRIFSPEDFKIIRTIILTKVLRYFSLSTTEIKKFKLSFEPDSPNFELLGYLNDELIFNVDLITKKIIITTTPEIMEIEMIEIPKLKKDILTIGKNISNEKLKLDEETIRDSRSYVSSLLFPKHHAKKVSSVIEDSSIAIENIEARLDLLTNETKAYYMSKEYLRKKEVSDVLLKKLCIKK